MKKGIISTAYPNYDYNLDGAPPRDTKKWINTAREIYYKAHKGLDRAQAFEQLTSTWDKMEKKDFQNWLRYYEEGAHSKYKTAQVNYWENANRAGYFVPMHSDMNQIINQPQPANTLNYVKDPETHPDIKNDERKEIIEKHRSKIIGRLDSAEKLLRSEEGQLFAGEELEALLDSIYALKKKIHMVNKISTSETLYLDMIIREANILGRKGFASARTALYKVAQAPAVPEAANPVSNGGLPGNIPGGGPGMTPPPTNAPTQFDNPQEPLSEGMSEFLDGLETNNDTFNDEEDEEKNNKKDVLEVKEDELVSKAQDAGAAPPQNLEVKEDEDVTGHERDFDNLIDVAFQNLTIQDVVTRLQDLTKIFKVREIPRQLSIIDMMLDRLGLASFFPSLAEATNKSLESNQYISTRVEDILSRLSGTLETKEIDLKNDLTPEVSPAVKNIQNNLQQEQDKEKSRKQMRKNIEDEALMPDKVTPDIEVEEDLAQPSQLQSTRPPAPQIPRPQPPVPVR